MGLTREQELNVFLKTAVENLKDSKNSKLGLQIIEWAKEKQKLVSLKLIDNLENPYPEDIFPRLLMLTDKQSNKLNKFLLKEVGITLDRFSAELMRRSRENTKEDLSKQLKQEGFNSSHN